MLSERERFQQIYRQKAAMNGGLSIASGYEVAGEGRKCKAFYTKGKGKTQEGKKPTGDYCKRYKPTETERLRRNKLARDRYAAKKKAEGKPVKRKTKKGGDMWGEMAEGEMDDSFYQPSHFMKTPEISGPYMDVGGYDSDSSDDEDGTMFLGGAKSKGRKCTKLSKKKYANKDPTAPAKYYCASYTPEGVPVMKKKKATRKCTLFDQQDYVSKNKKTLGQTLSKRYCASYAPQPTIVNGQMMVPVGMTKVKKVRSPAQIAEAKKRATCSPWTTFLKLYSKEYDIGYGEILKQMHDNEYFKEGIQNEYQIWNSKAVNYNKNKDPSCPDRIKKKLVFEMV